MQCAAGGIDWKQPAPLENHWKGWAGMGRWTMHSVRSPGNVPYRHQTKTKFFGDAHLTGGAPKLQHVPSDVCWPCCAWYWVHAVAGMCGPFSGRAGGACFTGDPIPTRLSESYFPGLLWLKLLECMRKRPGSVGVESFSLHSQSAVRQNPIKPAWMQALPHIQMGLWRIQYTISPEARPCTGNNNPRWTIDTHKTNKQPHSILHGGRLPLALAGGNFPGLRINDSCHGMGCRL